VKVKGVKGLSFFEIIDQAEDDSLVILFSSAHHKAIINYKRCSQYVHALLKVHSSVHTEETFLGYRNKNAFKAHESQSATKRPSQETFFFLLPKTSCM
jgi:hypothetical protein